MRAMLVKSAFLGRSSADEPSFLPLYLASLYEADPAIGSCCAAIWWDWNDASIEQSFLRGIDFLVGWGGPDAEAHFRAVKPESLPWLFYGHRLGFAVVDTDMVSGPTARALALEIARFDQLACLSPHAVFVLGDEVAAQRLGAQIADALERQRWSLPPRTPDVAQAAALNQHRAVIEMAAAMGTATLHIPPDGSAAWTVSVETPDAFPVSPLCRTVTVVPVDDLAALYAYIQPHGPLLQNAAIAVDGPQGAALRQTLAEMGVSRLCPPGQMATPSMMWHHDGQPCLATMVRWCDEERVPPHTVADAPAGLSERIGVRLRAARGRLRSGSDTP